MVRGPVAGFALAGAWGAFLYLTGAAEALGRLVPWPVSMVLAFVLVILAWAGGSAPRPDAFPHECAWRRVKASFVAVVIIACVTCYMALLFS